MCTPRFTVQADGVEMFVLGAALGSLVLLTDRRPSADRSDRRRRHLTDAQAVGYRAALGEVPDR